MAVITTTAKRAALWVKTVTMVVIASAQDSGGVWARQTRSTCPRRRCRCQCRSRQAGAPRKGGTTSWRNWFLRTGRSARFRFGARASRRMLVRLAVVAVAPAPAPVLMMVLPLLLLLLVVPLPLVVKVKGAVTWTVMSGVGG